MIGRLRSLGLERATLSLALSFAAHVVALTGVALVAYLSLASRRAREAESATRPPTEVIAVELPMMSGGALTADREEVPEGTPPDAYGGAAIARVDTGNPGRGGDTTGAHATNLAAQNDGFSFNMDTLSRLDRDQVQRLRTAPSRTTREDRRATTHPMELTFLATGQGEHPERRPSALTDPSRGSLASSAPSVVGGHPGASVTDREDAAGSSPGSSREGQLAPSPGLGVRDGAPGSDHRAEARIAYARPSVTEGRVTIPATTRGRPNDTIDSDQEVASTVRNLVHASVAGGRSGPGRGGAGGPEADPGSGGAEGHGSIARALGSGDGELVDWNTHDPMLMPYLRKIHAKVDPLWKDAFPKSAMAELKQGTVILEFTIALDGTAKVSWPPVRPSGIDVFDRNCADAIRRASPFEPIPAALRTNGRTHLRMRAPFEAKNPVVK